MPTQSTQKPLSCVVLFLFLLNNAYAGPGDATSKPSPELPPQTQSPTTCGEGTSGLCLTTVGMTAPEGESARLTGSHIADTLRRSHEENPQANLIVANAGSEAGTRMIQEIRARASVPIRDVSATIDTDHGDDDGPAEGNFQFAMVRGSANGVVTTLAFVLSNRHPSPVSLLPTLFAIFLMSGGIQVQIDPFHAWLKNGRRSQTLMPSLRSPENSARLEQWREREFYVKWFCTQFVFMIGIDLALIPAHVWEGKTLEFILAKTAINSLFAMFAEGSTEKVVVDSTWVAIENAKRENAAPEGLDRGSLKQQIKKYNQRRRYLAGTFAVISTMLSSFRNTSGDQIMSAFVPSDVPGAILFAMGVLGMGASAYLVSKRRKLGCREVLGSVPLRS